MGRYYKQYKLRPWQQYEAIVREARALNKAQGRDAALDHLEKWRSWLLEYLGHGLDCSASLLDKWVRDKSR